jgi:hypothetical protein
MGQVVYKVIPASKAADDEAALNALAKEGWCLSGGTGGNLYLMKTLAPHEAAIAPSTQHCFDCENFPEKSREAVAKCQRWGVQVFGAGGAGCDTFKTRSVVTKESPVEDPSAWHWQPRTEEGEKRIEAITSQEAGVSAPSHKHRVQVIICKKGKVIRGKTDMVNGHFHVITILGMADEADGHTHSFVVPDKLR